MNKKLEQAMSNEQPLQMVGTINAYSALLAKNAGFRWNSPVHGAWTKKLSEIEATELDFKVEILN